MAYKYPISTEEQLALIEQVLSNDIEMHKIKPDKKNVFAFEVFGFTSVIKFTDYDCAIKFWLPMTDKEFEKYFEVKSAADEMRELFKVREKELRKAMRAYKKEVYGEAFSKDCDRYNKTKKRLHDSIAENNKHIKKLTSQIDNLYKQRREYQFSNQQISTQIQELEME